MAELEINGQQYLTGKLPTREKFHIAKRLAPATPFITPAALRWRARLNGHVNGVEPLDYTGIAAGVGITPEILPEGWTPALVVEITGLVSNILPLLSDVDFDYILDSCLAVVRFRSGNAWAPLKPAGSSLVMYEPADDFATQSWLVVAVLVENLLGFTPETLLQSPTTTILAAA